MTGRSGVTTGRSGRTADRRDRLAGPTIWQAMLADPAVPIDPVTLGLVVADQRRWSRRWLYPVVRPLTGAVVVLIRLLRRAVPLAPPAHATMDRLCVWFLHRFVSPQAGALLVRHFLVETNLLQFIVRNAGLGDDVRIGLRPTSLAELGDRAVLEHDINVYQVLVALGRTGPPVPPPRLDTSMLAVEPVDSAPGVRRWVNLDIQTALCLMNVPFALCLTAAEYQRAVHSLRLDESLLAMLADLTGDERFLRWRPGTTVVRVDSGLDVPRAVYEHALICEYAHAHLRRLAATVARPDRATVGTERNILPVGGTVARLAVHGKGGGPSFG